MDYRVEQPRPGKVRITIECDVNSAVDWGSEAGTISSWLEESLRDMCMHAGQAIERWHQEDTEIGRVKWFDPSKGYGFIRSVEQEEVFVHHTGIVGEGFKELQKGQLVRFKRLEHRERVEAVDVRACDSEVQETT